MTIGTAEAVVEAKERPIKQGDDGDFLFVIEVGKLECHIKNTDDDGEMMVKTVEADDAFGELTLFYNCPPAASVEAAERSTPWKLDGGSFNSIVEDAALNKRDRYEACENVEVQRKPSSATARGSRVISLSAPARQIERGRGLSPPAPLSAAARK